MPYSNMLNILAGGIQTKPTWDYMNSMNQGLDVTGKMQALRERPETLNWLRKSRQMVEEKHLAEMDSDSREKELFPIRQQVAEWDQMLKAKDLMGEMLPSTTPESYEKFRSKFEKSGTDVLLPPLRELEEYAMREKGITDSGGFRKFFEEFKGTAHKSFKKMISELEIQGKVIKAKADLARWESYGKPKAQKPEMFVDETGNLKWLEPGAEIPEGWTPYQKPEKEAQPREYEPKLFQKGDELFYHKPGEAVPPGSAPYKPPAAEREARPSDFEKKWAISAKIAREGLKRAPTEEEIAGVYKAKFGAEGLLGSLFGIGGGGNPLNPAAPPAAGAPGPIPKFK